MRYRRYIPVPYRQPINLVLILGALIVIYFIGKKNKWWGRPEKGATQVKPKKEYNPVRSGFNADNEAVAIAELFSYTDFNDLFTAENQRKDYRAFKRILDHSHNENIEIHNAWMKRYAGGKYWQGISDTLRKQVEAEYIDPWRTETLALKKKVIARLNFLGL